MNKREWVYCHKPTAYEISCDKCNGSNTTWSEYEKMIWCYDCEIDTKGNGGIFNGAIPLGLCKMMGISFDRIRLRDNKLLKMVDEDGKLTWVEEDEK